MQLHDLSCHVDNQRGLWIGGEKGSGTSLWKWTTSNRSITWNDWYPGKPSENGDNCILMNRNQDFQGRWKNQDCTTEIMHVCEFVMV